HLNARGLAILRARAQISNADNSAEYLPADATGCGCNASKFSTDCFSSCKSLREAGMPPDVTLQRFNGSTVQRAARRRDFSSIVVVIMMAMVAVISSTPVIPAVSVATVVIRIWLGIRVVRPPVVPVRIIIVACRISVIASWKPKTESHSGNPDGHLSISTLPGNKSQSTYRQSN